MTREERFAAANDKREEDKKKDEERKAGGGYGDYPDISYVALQAGKQRVLRLLGEPVASRDDNSFESAPSDPKKVFMAWIKADDDKNIRVIFPDVTTDEGKNYLLFKIYKLVTDYKWNKETKSKEFKHQTTHTGVFNRVAFNDNLTNQYATGWKPSKGIVINVIDRLDPTWHAENKKTKLLSKKSWEKSDGSYGYDSGGVPEACYNAVWDSVVEYSGDFENYDVVLTKLTDKPWYDAKHAVKDWEKVEKDSKKMDCNIKEFIVDAPLTEAEKNYERHDLDKMFQVTKHKKIKSRLGAFIAQVDATFKTNFIEQLDRLVEGEEEDYKQQQAADVEAQAQEEAQTPSEAEKSTPVAETTQAPIEEAPASTEAPKTEAPPARRVAKETSNPYMTGDSVNWEGLKANGYLGIDKMTAEEKASVKSVEESGVFNYTEGLELIPFEEGAVGPFTSPSTFKVCPLNGVTFE